MYLKRMEIVGFKSFANAFELEFRKGISCIVGPNGCGKSNVADAIRWALGSQSPSELRADRMEDVIFSGTDDRKPLGMAEVVLTFDNTLRELPLEFDEVTVTRRLFRSGESEYLINGNRCRLMDVTDLIVDRGLGSNSYWILETSMVKAIIESRPADRRSLFDEAAGIVKYKIQRHRAELKLNAASGDLERLDDIILEVNRNVAVLRKQVRAYKRWRSAEDRITELDGLLRFRQLDESRSRMAELESRLKESRGLEQECSAAVSSTAARQGQARVELEKAQAQLDREHEACASVDAELGAVNEKHAVALERKRNEERQAVEAEEGSKMELQRSGDILDRIESLTGRIAELTAAGDEVAAEHGKVAAESSRLEKAGSDSSARLDEARKTLREASEALRGVQEEYGDLLREAERAEQELETSRNRLLVLESSIGGIDDALKVKRDLMDRLQEELEERSAELEELSGRLSTLDGEIEGRTAQCTATDTRMELLRSRLEKLTAQSDTDSSGESRISDLVDVTGGMGLAVGAWLDAFQDSVVISEISLPEGDVSGRYLVRREEGERPEIPEGAVLLPDCLETPADPAVSALLSRCIVAPDRETAIQWFLEGSELDIVTGEGDLFRRDGLVRLGIPEAGAGSIEREGLADRIRSEIGSLSAEYRELDTLREDLRGRRKEIAGKVESCREALGGIQSELASENARFAGLDARRKEMASELSTVTAAVPELERRAGESGEGSLAHIEAMQTEVERLTEASRKLETEHSEITERLNRAIREENETALRQASNAAELSQARSEQTRLKQDAAEAKKRSGELSLRSGELSGSCKALGEKLEDLSRQREDLTGKRETAEGRRTEASRSRAEWLERTRELDRELSALRERLSEAREVRATLSGEADALSAKLKDLESRELELPQEKSRYWKLPVEELEKELARQHGYRENLGPVNMLAVTEYEEARKRIDFLTAQRGDLMDARGSLLEAIDEINRTAAERFTETFAEVRRNFQEMFSSLFGGGEADLLSLEADDPLEGGVQIVARPPGKKLENVTALSSGERAMTAVALLFALYLVKPSPFCVLDELDAPLDDSNVDHFVDLVQSFVDRTQFIVITHNKRTMEAADRLFGITMVEKGVSSMTTVNLRTAMEMGSEGKDAPDA